MLHTPCTIAALLFYLPSAVWMFACYNPAIPLKTLLDAAIDGHTAPDAEMRDRVLQVPALVLLVTCAASSRSATIILLIVCPSVHPGIRLSIRLSI